MTYPNSFEGFLVKDDKNWSTFYKSSFKPKPFEDHDVDVVIEACGVCGSDVHTITGGWGKAHFPLCVGHEIIGKVIKVGPKVTLAKVGQRVGVGAQIWACLECNICKSDNENYCPHLVNTYNGTYPDGTISQGGYSSHIRAHEYFTFPIPDNISSAIAAPMMCAGLTTYSPLRRAGIGLGKKVAIIGVGGLGHFGIMWANALGAEVTVLSHSPSKEDDALKLGAEHFVLTTGEDWASPLAFTFDFILNTADMTHTFDMSAYLSTLAVNGTFHNVGMPDADLPPLNVLKSFAPNGCHISGSRVGCRTEMLDMLKLASEKAELRSWVEEVQIGEEGCKKAVEGVKENQVRYRYTLVGFDKAFPGRATSA